jgi:hypothetical protein
MRLLGRTHRRPEVWRAYRQAYETFGHHPNTSWVSPNLSELGENVPYFRLPVLDDALPAGAVAVELGR